MSNSHDEPMRRRVIYSGRVQGVGFRYTAQQIAAGFRVTGFVRNLPDGTVELLAQGAERDLTAFLDAVRAAMRGNIRDARESDVSIRVGEDRFQILH